MIIPYRDWCDVSPRGIPPRIADRQPRLWLHHGASGTSTIDTARAYARYHIRTRGWTSVGYSFLIAEGKVLEGRGVGRQGAHTSGDNSSSYGICLVGEYGSKPPSDRDLDALVWLIRHGHARGWWPNPQLTSGHRDAPGASTSCPGDAAYRLIPTINAQARQTTTPAVPEEDDDLTPEQAKKLDEIHAALAADQTQHNPKRIRDSIAALGAKVGVKVDPVRGEPRKDVTA